MSKEKKPTNGSLKSTIIKSVTAVACTALLFNAISSSFGSMAEADKLRAQAELDAASATGNTSTAQAIGTDSSSSAANGYGTADSSVSSAASGSDEGTAASDVSTPASSEGSSETQQSAAQSGTSAATADKSGMPQTKAEILSYCNTALNNAKAAKVGYTKTFVRKGGDNLPSVIQSVIAQNKTTTAEKGSSGIKDDFPAAGFDWSSKLREQDIKSANIKQNGQYYEILIQLDKETNPGKGESSKYGRIMSVIDANDAKEMVPGIKSITMTYHDGYVYAKIDSKTGKLVKAEFSASADINASISVLGNLKADNLISTETFTDIKW